jgi:hypothetical protein
VRRLTQESCGLFARKSFFDYPGNIIPLAKPDNGIDTVGLVEKLPA